MNNLLEIEQALFARYVGNQPQDDVPIVFILASPRSGSTMLYQLLIHLFDFFYFPNFVNERFAEYPVVGATIAVAASPPRGVVDLFSSYGKTQGAFGTSEASAVFHHWFGGEHPSQLRSAKVLDGKEIHIKQTIASIYAMTGTPIVTKNAWNCFRVEELSRLFPRSLFLYLKRDIRHCALSDLESRYRHGGPMIWNSATPANVDEIKNRPYWEQVVEQQYAYHTSLENDLGRVAPDRFHSLWYEACCDRTSDIVDELGTFFTQHGCPAERRDASIPELKRSEGPAGMNADREKVLDYVQAQHDRLRHLFYDDVITCEF